MYIYLDQKIGLLCIILETLVSLSCDGPKNRSPLYYFRNFGVTQL